jgi:hypothetical protein
MLVLGKDKSLKLPRAGIQGKFCLVEIAIAKYIYVYIYIYICIYIYIYVVCEVMQAVSRFLGTIKTRPFQNPTWKPCTL